MDEVSPTFYATVATVLPVLWLVLAIEYRLFRQDERESVVDSLFLLSVVLVILAGELVALVALYEGGQPSELANVTVIMALALSLMGVSVPLVKPRFAVIHERLGRHARRVEVRAVRLVHGGGRFCRGRHPRSPRNIRGRVAPAVRPGRGWRLGRASATKRPS